MQLIVGIFMLGQENKAVHGKVCVYVCLLLELCQFYIGTGIGANTSNFVIVLVSVKHVMLG